MFKKIKYLLLSLLVVGKHLFKKSVTLEYPEEKNKLSDYYRGKFIVENCVGCNTCTKVCPSGAIKIIKNETEIAVKIDLKKCIFCGNCSFYCPKHAIKMSKEYELATSNKNDLELVYTIKREV